MNTEPSSPWMRGETEGISLQQGSEGINSITLQENGVLMLSDTGGRR